jgi:glycosyltransferase involved in cell wall biosynthesis
MTLSIITPSYNQGPFIERTIQSVLSQGIPDLEYIICDGGSTDDTLEILKRFQDHLNWISEKDKGQADAVNKGIQNTSGEIIGWINSDDIYYPGALANVLDFFENNPSIEVIFGDANHIDENDQPIEPYYTEDWNYERLKDVCYLCQPAVFFRRRVVEKKGLLDVDLRYCMDYEYWLRLGTDTVFYHLKKLLAGSRMYKHNKTLGSRVAVHLEILKMTQRKFGKPPLRWIYNYAHAKTEAKGYDRESLSGKKKFIPVLVANTVTTFFRFYHYLPWSAVETIWGWTGKSLFQKVQQRAKG